MQIHSSTPYYTAINFALLLIKKLRCETLAMQRMPVEWSNPLALPTARSPVFGKGDNIHVLPQYKPWSLENLIKVHI